VRARGRDLGVGAQDRKVGVLAVELRERLGVVAVRHDLEPQPRGIGLQYGGKPGGEARLGTVGFADGKDQRFGVSQPGPAAPDRCGGQDQGQNGEQQICERLLLTTRERRRGNSGCGVEASALMAHTRSEDVRLAKSAPQAVRMNS
jgi:hypothetical protein